MKPTKNINLSVNNKHSGQTLVVAIMVMFILAIVVTVFVAIVARNLLRSERFSRVDAVAQIAEAGIRFADKMLTSSEEGADWRPIPDNLGLDPANPGDITNGTIPQPLSNWENLRERNPDFKWTRPYWPVELPIGSQPGMGYAGPTGGYTTFNFGQGRFLLRVSYNPNPRDPMSKYIKIESIGRWGVVLNDDPTTWASAGKDINMRRELTAYKPIGVTDYLRFVTNKDNRSADFALGCPGFAWSYGRSLSSVNGFRGGPLRVNGNLVFYGTAPNDGADDVRLFLRGVVDNNSNKQPIDRVEVSGEIKMADDNTTVKLIPVIYNGTSRNEDPEVTVLPSDDGTAFTTAGGFIRDGSSYTDVNKLARGIKRIEPPDIEQLDLTNSTSRYRLLTLHSGEQVKLGNRWVNLGQYGWGRGIYINNNSDKQGDSETLIGGYTVRADWLNPNSPLSTYWKGPFYVPPAVIINLHPYDTDGDGQPDLTITRTDANMSGRGAIWRDAWGNPRKDWGQKVTMPYPIPGRTVRSDYGGNIVSKRLDGNGVIFAEGNIRIRGMLPKGVQLTVVSNENIYRRKPAQE